MTQLRIAFSILNFRYLSWGEKEAWQEKGGRVIFPPIPVLISFKVYSSLVTIYGQVIGANNVIQNELLYCLTLGLIMTIGLSFFGTAYVLFL